MGFVKVKAREAVDLDNWISITSSGITFCAEFIKDNKLTHMDTCTFFQDEENPYRFAFELYPDRRGQFKLQKNNRDGYDSNGRHTKGNSFTSMFPVLDKLRKVTDKSIQRRFTINKDKSSGMYCWEVRPNFEWSVEPAGIPSDVSGIYRYLTKEGEVTYIGKGKIKERFRKHKSAGKTALLDRIEYSVIEDEEIQKQLEYDYVLEHLIRYGALPRFNYILPPNPRK